jgi:hypothetical protein
MKHGLRPFMLAVCNCFNDNINSAISDVTEEDNERSVILKRNQAATVATSFSLLKYFIGEESMELFLS